MASGNDPPQLPRGLIGRTGAPSGKGARLPSIRGPRDLTLGGVQKKVFVPNIPARRTKPNESKSDESASTSNKAAENQSKKSGGSGGRGRGNGDRGRGRGRGRGRMSSNVIQTHSLFEQGPTEKVHKPTGGSDYTYSGGNRSGGGGGSSSPSKKFIKKEKTDEETKEVLDNLLRDDFIAGGGIEDEDVTLMPVKLPLEFKDEIDSKSEDYTKVKIKPEPMDTEDGVTNDDNIKSETDKKEDMLKFKPEERLTTCSELFTNSAKSDGQLFYFQLPDMLPGLPATTDEDFKKKKTSDKKTDDSAENDLNKKLSGCNLDSFSDGQIGKLIVHKSGRVQLMLGNTYLDVNMGTPCGFLQDVVSIKYDDTTQGDVSILGHVDHRLVCTPDFEMLLDNS